MKFLYDLLPVILFFGTFKVAQTNPDSAAALCNQWLGSGFQADQAPVICATAAAIIVSLLQIGVKFVRREKIDPMLWISVAVILVFGSLTIWLHDEMFIKWKPTILYWIFGGILLGGSFMHKNFLKSLLGNKVSLPDPAWNILLRGWIGFFAVTGVLNLIVAYTCSTDVWVNFKLFGLMGLTLLFTLGELRFTDYTRPESGRAPAAGSLYHLFVISRRFEGLPKIDRHRIVYEYLKPFIGHGIHNINMTLLAPSESRH